MYAIRSYYVEVGGKTLELVHPGRGHTRITSYNVCYTKLLRIAVPRKTRRESVSIPRAEFDAEWVTAEGTAPERVLLYLPGGAYIIRTPNLHTAMVSRLCRVSYNFV